MEMAEDRMLELANEVYEQDLKIREYERTHDLAAPDDAAGYEQLVAGREKAISELGEIAYNGLIRRTVYVNGRTIIY